MTLFLNGSSSRKRAQVFGACSSSSFASKMGALAGNHFLTVVEGQENLYDFGRLVLWEGAQDIVFSAA